MAKAQSRTTTAIALPKLDREEKTLDLRLRLKGRAAVDLADYQAAYGTDHGETIETELLTQQIIATFLERDRAFQSRRRPARRPRRPDEDRWSAPSSVPQGTPSRGPS